MKKKQTNKNQETSNQQPANSTGSNEDKSSLSNPSNSDIESLHIIIEEEKGKRMQLMADFENYKKRIESEKAMFGAIANLGLIKELLEISDDITLALQDDSINIERAKESLSIAQSKLTAAASNAGVEKIEINTGDDFNKDLMEAITMVEDSKMKGKVITVVSSAYKYANNDQIIKPAKVIVGR